MTVEGLAGILFWAVEGQLMELEEVVAALVSQWCALKEFDSKIRPGRLVLIYIDMI